MYLPTQYIIMYLSMLCAADSLARNIHRTTDYILTDMMHSCIRSTTKSCNVVHCHIEAYIVQQRTTMATGHKNDATDRRTEHLRSSLQGSNINSSSEWVTEYLQSALLTPLHGEYFMLQLRIEGYSTAVGTATCYQLTNKTTILAYR